MTRWLILALLLVAAGCRKAPEPPPAKHDATLSADREVPEEEPRHLVTFNAGLAHNYVPYADERRDALPAALAALEADALCLQEVWEDADADALQAALRTVYPHALRIDQGSSGPGEGPPCTPEDLGPVAGCVQANCTGVEDLTGCVLKQCGKFFFGLPGNCRNCLAANVSKPLEEVVAGCTAKDAQTWAYDGRNGLLLLSKHPFETSVLLPLDSFFLRRAVLHAVIRIPGGPLHLFCTHLTTPLSEVEYAGKHGSWQAEQAAQVDALIALVKENAGDAPAVVMGDLNCGPANAEWEVEAEFPDHIRRFAAAGFRNPYTEDHGHCTWCGIESLGAPKGHFKILDHLLFHNFGETLLHPQKVLEQTLPVGPADAPVHVPLSDHYGVRVTFDMP